MDIYYDTSIVVKLYIPEEGSVDFIDHIVNRGKPVSLNQLQETELNNALCLKFFRREISSTELDELLGKIQRDFNSGKLLRLPVEWPAAWQRAQRLARKHSAAIGCRTLDIIHVAIAETMKVGKFFTNDTRQGILASRLGMNTNIEL